MLNIYSGVGTAIRNVSRKLAGDKQGVTALEYSLVAAALVVTVMVGFNQLATNMSSQFNTIGLSL